MDNSPAPAGAKAAEKTVASLRKTIAELEDKKLWRSSQEVKLRLAQELIKEESWDDALRTLRPLWQTMSWRSEGWWDLTEQVGRLLRKVASHVGDGGTVVAVDWELMNDMFKENPDTIYDITKSLENIEAVNFKPAVVIRDRDIHSFLFATFAFDQAEGKVGEPCTSQLTVTSHASAAASPVTMTEIKISFEGNIKPVALRHEDKDAVGESHDEATMFNKVPLTEENMSKEDAAKLSAISARTLRPTNLVGKADLTFRPGESRVFEFTCPLREPGRAKAISATFSLSSDLFDLDYIVYFDGTVNPDIWWVQKPGARKRVVRVEPHAITILPKAPKMDIRIESLKEQYYTNETIHLPLEIFNGEDEETISNLSIKIPGPYAPTFKVQLAGHQKEAEDSEEEDSITDGSGDDELSSIIKLGSIQSSKSILAALELSPVSLPATYEINLELSYSLVSDPETPISRLTAVRLAIVSPFEANYDFSPRFDTRPWPSFFDHTEGGEVAQTSPDQPAGPIPCGLPQKWCLTTRYASFALDTIIVKDIDIEILSLNGSVSCTIKKPETDGNLDVSIKPSTIEECHFDILSQKLSLDDRRSASLDLTLAIKWQRDIPDAPVNTTSLSIPRLLIASSEPRVLASVDYSTIIPSVMNLEYMIENPSMHFLTFSVVMNPSDKFAFAGIKQSTVQLLPLSRRSLRINILPTVRGEWIRPQLIVTDRYFQKVLKVAPTEGMKVDKEGILVWVPPDEE